MYFWDVLGDRNNLLFGYLHHSDIPEYRRQRYCVGLPITERIIFTRGMGYIVTGMNSNSTSYIARYCKTKYAASDPGDGAGPDLKKKKKRLSEFVAPAVHKHSYIVI